MEIIMSDLAIQENPAGRRYRFPFNRLGIGQCFIVKGLRCNTLSPYKRYAEVALDVKFITKTLPNNEGVAVWRVR